MIVTFAFNLGSFFILIYIFCYDRHFHRPIEEEIQESFYEPSTQRPIISAHPKVLRVLQ